MKKETKYVMFGLLGLAVILAISFYMRYKSLQTQISNVKPPTPPNTNTGGSTPTPPPPAPSSYSGTNAALWKKGDAIRLLTGDVNLYNTPVASSSNIQKNVSLASNGFTPFANFDNISNGWIAVKYVSTNYIGFSTVQTGYIYSPSNQNITN